VAQRPAVNGGHAMSLLRTERLERNYFGNVVFEVARLVLLYTGQPQELKELEELDGRVC
jgi:hypothetical protein